MKGFFFPFFIFSPQTGAFQVLYKKKKKNLKAFENNGDMQQISVADKNHRDLKWQ